MLVLPAKLGHLGIFFLFPNGDLPWPGLPGIKTGQSWAGGERRGYCSFPSVGSYTLIIPTAESHMCARVDNDKHPLSWPSVRSKASFLRPDKHEKYASGYSPCLPLPCLWAEGWGKERERVVLLRFHLPLVSFHLIKSNVAMSSSSVVTDKYDGLVLNFSRLIQSSRLTLGNWR